jgi:putative SOS response-associated peptidase YedK
MEEIIEAFKVQQLLLSLEPRYNIAPSQMVPIIFTAQDGDEDAKSGQRILRAARWGFIPEWVKDIKKYPPMINARGESVAEKNSYRHAFKLRRCVIPADGFYEWEGQGKDRLPFHIGLKGKVLFGFAGLYEDWTSPDGSMIRTCAIITVHANEVMRKFHDRMPAILRTGEENTWLDQDQADMAELQSLLRPYPEEPMECYRVSKRVNGTTFNDKDLARKLDAGEAEYQPPPKEKKTPAKTAPQLTTQEKAAKKAQEAGVQQLNLFDLSPNSSD